MRRGVSESNGKMAAHQLSVEIAAAYLNIFCFLFFTVCWQEVANISISQCFSSGTVRRKNVLYTKQGSLTGHMF